MYTVISEFVWCRTSEQYNTHTLAIYTYVYTYTYTYIIYIYIKQQQQPTYIQSAATVCDVLY